MFQINYQKGKEHYLQNDKKKFCYTIKKSF